MKNILNCASGTRIKGKEIKEWIKFHSIFQTPYTHYAIEMLNYLNISDDEIYQVCEEDCRTIKERFYLCEYIID